MGLNIDLFIKRLEKSKEYHEADFITVPSKIVFDVS